VRNAGDGRDEGQWRAARQSAGAEAPPVDLLLHGLDTDALKGGRSGQAAVMDELRGSLCEYDRHCGGSSLVPGKKPVRQEMPRKAQTDSILAGQVWPLLVGSSSLCAPRSRPDEGKCRRERRSRWRPYSFVCLVRRLWPVVGGMLLARMASSVTQWSNCPQLVTLRGLTSCSERWLTMDRVRWTSFRHSRCLLRFLRHRTTRGVRKCPSHLPDALSLSTAARVPF